MSPYRSLQKRDFSWMGVLCLGVALSITAPAAFGDEPERGDPSARIARLNYVSGAVSFKPASVDDWTEANINRPLTTGDSLWTDADGRAELHVASTAVRLGPSTAFGFFNLNDDTVQIRLTQGTINLRVRRLNPGEVIEVDLPDAAVSLTQPGDYRFDANEGRNQVIVRRGEAEATLNGEAVDVREGQMLVLSGAGQDDGDPEASYDLQEAPGRDGLEQWAASRDRREDSPVSLRYVPRDMVGYEDLDEHGNWETTAEYGPVWYPRTVAADWAPYRMGHWAWVDPWGWTWVDDAPWGFAPFHYGRWAHYHSRWCWVPGRMVARPVYAPALVAFIGAPGVSVSVGVGAVSWFPLGPAEPYYPIYHVSPVYVRNVNYAHVAVANATTIYSNGVYTTNFVNRHVVGAVTAVPPAVFASARPVYQSRVMAPAVSGGVVIAAPAVAPRAQSVLGRPGAVARVAMPPSAVIARPVVARASPPVVVPFRARESALAEQPGRPLPPHTLNTLRTQTTVAAPPVRPALAPRPGGAAPMRPAREGLPPPRAVNEARPSPRPEARPDVRPGSPAEARPSPRPYAPPGSPPGNPSVARPPPGAPPANREQMNREPRPDAGPGGPPPVRPAPNYRPPPSAPPPFRQSPPPSAPPSRAEPPRSAPPPARGAPPSVGRPPPAPSPAPARPPPARAAPPRGGGEHPQRR